MGTERKSEMRRGGQYECCSCGNHREALRAIDFALVETALYLDAYPDSCEALAYYHKLLAERKSLMADYTQHYGPLTQRDNTSQTSWQWVKTPWPWEHEAN